MIVLTTSMVLPMIEAAGVDIIWFGIFIVLVVEMAEITPPLGCNLFVLQNFADVKEGDIIEAYETRQVERTLS